MPTTGNEICVGGRKEVVFRKSVDQYETYAAARIPARHGKVSVRVAGSAGGVQVVVRAVNYTVPVSADDAWTNTAPPYMSADNATADACDERRPDWVHFNDHCTSACGDDDYLLCEYLSLRGGCDCDACGREN